MRLHRFLLLAAAAVAAVSSAAADSDCRVKTRAPAVVTDAPVASATSSAAGDADAETPAATSIAGSEENEADDDGASAVDADAASATSDADAYDDTTDGETSAVDDTSSAVDATSSADDATSAAADASTEADADTDASTAADASTDVDADADTKADTTTAPASTTATPASTTATPTATSSASSNSTAASTTTSSSGELCSTPRVTVKEIDVGVAYEYNEDEAGLRVLAISGKPSGGSFVAVQSGDYAYVYELDSDDALVSTTEVAKVPAIDFADIYADDEGFVIMISRDAEGGGTLNCGSPSNLCGTAPNPAVPCYDMYLARYESGKETWATKLTSSSASLPPYSTSATGPEVYMIWWYAHHGRIAYDGTNWASYFGCALSVSEDSCINIHQGDRMKVVDPSGSVLSDHNSFDWGCSHSGYERITYDNRSDSFAMICKTDSNNRIMPPNNWDVTIYPVDLEAANLGDIVMDGSSSGGGYWATVSNSDSDDAAVHLIHFTLDAKADQDITLKGGKANERAPHLASIGSGGMVAMWEGSATSGDLVEDASDRSVFIQVLDSASGDAISDVVTLDSSVYGNRYQALKTYADGSVAYLSKGSSSTSLQVVRIHGC